MSVSINNDRTMEIGWTDVGIGGYILVSCAHSNTSLTCPFGLLTKISTCPTQFFSCPKEINKYYKNQRIIISNLCKMFWLLSHKHYLALSLLTLTDIMIMTSLIDKLTNI
jgi:hypothetical protein